MLSLLTCLFLRVLLCLKRHLRQSPQLVAALEQTWANIRRRAEVFAATQCSLAPPPSCPVLPRVPLPTTPPELAAGSSQPSRPEPSALLEQAPLKMLIDCVLPLG